MSLTRLNETFNVDITVNIGVTNVEILSSGIRNLISEKHSNVDNIIGNFL